MSEALATMERWNDPAVRALVTDILVPVRDDWADRGDLGGDHGDAPDAIATLVMEHVRRAKAQVLAGRALPPSRLEDAVVWRSVREALVAEVVGLGRIQPLLDDREVTDIHVNAPDVVFVRWADGRRERAPRVADDDADLVSTWQRAARRLGTSEIAWDDGHPQALVDLPSEHRVTLVRPPMVRRPTVTIRRPTARLHRLVDLEVSGSFSSALASWLAAAVRARLNIVVAGDQGAGKTTVMRALLNEIGPDERLVTIEEGNYELLLSRMADPLGGPLHPDLVEMLTRPENTEGAGEWTLTDLLRHSKRQNADRVIVGEVRDSEASQMVDAMIASTGGSMCTVHAKSARDAISRLRALMTRHGSLSEGPALELLVAAVDLVVFCSRDRETGRRTVSEVIEVAGIDDGRVGFADVWSAPGVGELAQPAGTGGSQALRAALAAVGHDPQRLAPTGRLS